MPPMELSTWLSAGRGRGVALARYLRIPASMVSKMASGEKEVPLAHCPYIESFTAGEVTCEELLPERTEYFSMLRSRVADSTTSLSQQAA